MNDLNANTFKWGIIGTGGIARAFAQDISLLGNHRVVAVASRTQESARKAQEHFPDARMFSQYQDLLETEGIDAIYVATPHQDHVTSTLMALDAGKPVLVEKPFAINYDDAKAMIDKARTSQLPLLEAMWTRFLPHIHELREILSSDGIGEVHTLIADHGQNLPPEKAPRLWDRKLGGGALLDLGIYPVSFSHLVFGAPETITARALLSDGGCDIQTSAILTYADGAHACINTTMTNETANTAVISGSKGRIEIDSAFYRPTAMRVIHHGHVTSEYISPYQGIGLREQAREFEAMVRNEDVESELMPWDETLAVMATMDAIRAQIGLTYEADSK